MSTATIDQQFIEYVVKSLVGNPDDVVVERIIDEKGVLLTLTVNPEDLGRVIGKKGATAQSLRTLLRALGTKQEARYNLKIVDNGEPRPERTERPEQSTSDRGYAPREESNSYASNETTSVENVQDESVSTKSEDSWNTSEDTSSAAQDAANDSGEEESAIERTRRELEDLDDLDV
jgi:predicted RNA-binding protein YlqC (UPF0109 family)